MKKITAIGKRGDNQYFVVELESNPTRKHDSARIVHFWNPLENTFEEETPRESIMAYPTFRLANVAFFEANRREPSFEGTFEGWARLINCQPNGM